MNPLSPEELMELMYSGKVSIGCPIPGGHKPWTDEDKEKLREVMTRIVEEEEKLK